MNEGLAYLLICTLLCGTIIGLFYNSYQHKEKMASLGYIEVQAVGTADTLWVKP